MKEILMYLSFLHKTKGRGKDNKKKYTDHIYLERDTFN